MARKPITDMSAWPSLTLEGNLIAPAMVASVDRRQAPEQTEEHYRVRKGLTICEESRPRSGWVSLITTPLQSCRTRRSRRRDGLCADSLPNIWLR